MSIRCEQVSFAYDNGFLAVEDVSFTIAKGEKVAIIGQNGAGKTTTVKLLNGLLRPKSGKIFVNDEDIRKQTTATVSRKVGYVFQNPGDQIFNQTVYDEIAYTLRYFKKSPEFVEERVMYAAKMCQIEEYLKMNPYDLPFSLRKFVTIASVIAIDVDIIILDEPTAGQDLDGLKRQKYIIEELHKQNKTIITITHDMEFVIDNFERIIVMANKRVVGDARKEEIFWNFDVLHQAALKQPVVAQLAHRLKIDGQVVSIEDFVKKV